eukprot:TRINITY_DN9236_c0_g2_i1.p1 TRINITY_DN9236_c0_g2~~TRINITY_DN9236_c0_g2_i1.p1  ORF type:complete len:386 (-),score=75.01 TRINITY_DN9236_c0_g2_i1:1124-2281(-)
MASVSHDWRDRLPGDDLLSEKSSLQLTSPVSPVPQEIGDLDDPLAQTLSLLQQREQEAELAAKLGQLLLETNRQLTEENKSIRTKYDRLVQDFEDLKHKLEVTELQNLTLIKGRSEMSEAEWERNSEVEALKAEVKSLQLARSEALDLHSETVEQLEESERSIAELQATIKVLQIADAERRSEVTRLLEQAKRTEEDKVMTERTVRDARSHSASMEIKYNQLKRVVASLQGENRRLQEEAETKSDSLQELEQVVESQQVQMQVQRTQSHELLTTVRREYKSLKKEHSEQQRRWSLHLSSPNVERRNSLFFELEEQVAKKVESELQIPEASTLGDPSSLLWRTFLTYLPSLKSPSRLKELTQSMSDTDLDSMYKILQKVVNGKSRV